MNISKNIKYWNISKKWDTKVLKRILVNKNEILMY